MPLLRCSTTSTNASMSFYTGRKAFLATLLVTASFTGADSAVAPHFTSRQTNAATGEVLPYRNATLCIDERLDDLLSRMTVAEKAGQLFHASITMGKNGTLAEATSYRNSSAMEIGEKLMSHFNYGGDVENVREVAEWHNLLQRTALETRLGIPISISSDPRHSFTENIGTGFAAKSLSQWPESLGLAALRDPAWTLKFAEIAREEYMALGLRGALHPQVDLSTEYRWARIANTMGEDANLTSQLVAVSSQVLIEQVSRLCPTHVYEANFASKAYIKGFQGEELGRNSVTTVTKHFPGAGPMENGEDSHFTYGKNQ